jgi:formiminotetrahydrofolate cyclodeaminase
LASSELLEKTVADLLDDVASETPAPGGGAVAAVAVALGAALAEMAARFSRKSWHGAEAALASARALRERAAPLAQADADAYAELLAAQRRPPGDSGREATLAAARSRAIAIPLEVAASGSEVAALAAALVEHGNPNLRGDAAAAALAASAGAAVGASLVEINVGGRDDERLAQARGLAAAAAAASERALAAAASVS